jgi:hypothetical protein
MMRRRRPMLSPRLRRAARDEYVLYFLRCSRVLGTQAEAGL